MKTSSIAVETSRSTTKSASIVRQMNKCSSCLSYTTMNNKYIFNNCTVLMTKDPFFDILTGYFLINQSSSSSKELAMRIALKIATVKYYKFQKSPTHFGFTTFKECSGMFKFHRNLPNFDTLLIHLSD